MTEERREEEPRVRNAGPASSRKTKDRSDVIIRRAEKRDIPALARMEKLCFSDAWSEASVEGSQSSPLGYLLIAEELCGEGTDLPLGYLIASVFEDEGELLRIAALPQERRRGVGKALLSRMLEDHPGVKTWRLDVRTQNMPAIALYEQFGFGIITENPNVYKDPVDNGYLMIRTDRQE